MYITTVILDHFRLKWWRPNFFSQSFGVPKGSSSWITGGLQVQKAMVLIYNGDEKYFLKKSHLKRVFPRILTHGVFEVLKCLVRTTGRGSCFFKNILWTLNIEWNLWVVVPTHVCYIYPQSDSPMCWGCGRTRWEANWSGLGLPACEVCSKMRLIFCILHIAPWSWTFSIDEVEMEKDKSEDVWVPKGRSCWQQCCDVEWPWPKMTPQKGLGCWTDFALLWQVKSQLMYITTVILDHFRLKWWRPNFFSQSFGVPKGSSSWITGGLQVQKAMVLIYNGDEKYFLKKSHLKRVFPRILTHGVFEVLKCLVRTTGRGSCFFKNILWTLNIEWNLWVVVPTHVCYIYPQSDSPMCWGCGRTRWEANWSGLGLPACEVCSKMRLIFCILHIAPWSWTFSIDEVEMEKDKSEDVWVPKGRSCWQQCCDVEWPWPKMTPQKGLGCWTDFALLWQVKSQLMYITTVILDHFRLKWWRPIFFSQSFGVPKESSSWITGGLQVQKAMVLIYNGDEKYFLKKSHLKRVFPRILTHGVFEVLKCLVRTTGRGSCFF